MVDSLSDFLGLGGTVLWLIALLAFLIWSVVINKLLYFRYQYEYDRQLVYKEWQEFSPHSGYYAIAMRIRLISHMSGKINYNMSIIRAMVGIAPMLGLLGTVTGMTSVFDIMAITGGGDVQLMAGGVFKAIIPTLSGMVVAVSGIFAYNYLDYITQRYRKTFSESMKIHSGA